MPRRWCRTTAGYADGLRAGHAPSFASGGSLAQRGRPRGPRKCARGPGDEGIAGNEVAKRPLSGPGDTDARSDDDIAVGHALAGEDAERRLVEPVAVLRSGDAKSEAELPRTVGQVMARARVRTPTLHQGLSFEGRHGANEHRAAMPLLARHRMEAPVHPVDQVDVRDPGRSEE